MQEFAKEFYSSPAWKQCREAYKKSVGGLCELCAKEGLIVAGEIVHHKIHLTPETIQDPNIALSFSNMQLVCRMHHAMLHSDNKSRFTIDSLGRVTARE